jgi:hypothetical protein
MNPVFILIVILSIVACSESIMRSSCGPECEIFRKKQHDTLRRAALLRRLCKHENPAQETSIQETSIQETSIQETSIQEPYAPTYFTIPKCGLSNPQMAPVDPMEFLLVMIGGAGSLIAALLTLDSII